MEIVIDTQQIESGGYKSRSEAHSKDIYSAIVDPFKQQSLKKTGDLVFFPLMKLNYLRTIINEKRDILRSSSNDGPEGIILNSYLERKSPNGNLPPTRRSPSMIGYLGDTSKVEQQLSMAAGLVAEETPMLGSLLGKSYQSQKSDHLVSLMKKMTNLKNNQEAGRDLLDSSSFRYFEPGTEKNMNNDHKNLDVKLQEKVINLSGIFPGSDNYLKRKEKDILPSSLAEKDRVRREVQKVSRLLGHVDNKGRTKRASIDLTNLLPPISLEIGRSAPKSENTESMENTTENERSGLNMEKTQSKRSTDKISRLLGSVDVTVNKGRAKRASIDLNNLLPSISLEIGRSAPKSTNSGEEMGRSRRASVDLSGILPTTNLQVGKSERSVAGPEPTQFSPLIVLFSDRNLDRASIDVPDILSVIGSSLRKLAKCEDDYTDADLEMYRQSSKSYTNPHE